MEKILYILIQRIGRKSVKRWRMIIRKNGNEDEDDDNERDHEEKRK